ncbi:MAG: hypothetical protein ACI9M1_001063, partial [Porticoccaceae bacterium]
FFVNGAAISTVCAAATISISLIDKRNKLFCHPPGRLHPR